MAQNRIIQQWVAGILLLVFTFSITPKKLLHDAIANHTDKTSIATSGGEAQVSNTGFVCKCDNLVAESPFTNTSTHFEFLLPRFFSIETGAKPYHFYSSTFFFFELRGPPANGS